MKRVKKDVHISARITPYQSKFLKERNLSVSDVIGKYYELMATDKEKLYTERRLLQEEIKEKKLEIAMLEDNLDKIDEQLKEINGGEAKTLEEECIEKMAEILRANGFAENNQNEKIFNKPNIMSPMNKYAFKCDLDYETFKNKVKDFVLQ